MRLVLYLWKVKRYNTVITINALLGILFLLFLGCNKSSLQEPEEMYYYSLKNYFNEEATRLEASKPMVKKMVTLNDKEEKKSLIIEDWNKELLTFIEADINKSAFAGKYEVDSIMNENKLQEIVYKAKDDKFKTREVHIFFDEAINEINAIEVLLEAHNTLYHSTQNLRYEKNNTYSVWGTQEIRFLKKDIFKVAVEF